jgi:hypothetical protein
LNPKPLTATSPAALRTKAGPLSRAHESSIGISTTDTPDEHRVVTSRPRPGVQTINTGSKSAMADATAA